MGCDIHNTLIARRISDGEWIDLRFDHNKDFDSVMFGYAPSKYYDLFTDFIEGRSYFLFGVLSAVRSSENYVETPYRHFGIPRGFHNEIHDHTPTWFYANDLRRLLKRTMIDINVHEIFGMNEYSLSSLSISKDPFSDDQKKNLSKKDLEDYKADLQYEIESSERKIFMLNDLIDKIDEFRTIVKKNVKEVDPNTLIIFVWYDS